VLDCFPLQTIAFRGHGFSLRRTERASAGVATGCRVLNLPQEGRKCAYDF